MDKESPVRLQKYLAICGVASRRKAELFILDGRVTVNGAIMRVLGTKVEVGDEVLFDGRQVNPETRKLYIALHKPRGYLCSSFDPEDRPLAVSLLSDRFPERLYSVGRLDFNTSGLILFTNDGDFAKVVSHPSSGIQKEYLVESDGAVELEYLEEFKAGVDLDGIRYQISDYVIVEPHRVRLILIEGKNREIRRFYAAKDLYIRRICRTRVGPVVLGDLRPTAHRMLTQHEIDWFLKKATENAGGRAR